MEEKMNVHTAKVIMTHNGTFHCDEVLATAMLTYHTNEFRNAKTIRSRKKTDWVNADVLLDVGGEFDVPKRRFDHHQTTFNETLSERHKTKLSTAGLIFKHFGKEVITDVLEHLHKEKLCNNDWTSKDIEDIYNYVYLELFESIDAIDNGISQYENADPPNYRITTDLSSRVARLNVSWNQTKEKEKEKDKNAMESLEMERFEKAMKVCDAELVECITICALSYIPARKIVETAILNRKQVHESGQIIEMTAFCPWTDHLFQLEKELSITSSSSDSQNTIPIILFAIFAVNNNEFCIRAVPLSPKSFKLRKQLKESWCGVPDSEIEDASGIKGLKFVHSNGFIAGAKTRDAALALAVQSLPSTT
jgi:uncharacterized UPF0160 family protein